MLRITTWSTWLFIPLCFIAQTVEPTDTKSANGKPALIATVELVDFDALPADRRALIAGALAVARDSPWMPYTARGTAPSDGGFDCSGAMYFVMRKAGLDPPRTAAGQLQWLKQNDRLHEVPPSAVNLNHPSLKDLHPGDLLFWGRRGSVDAGTKEEINHVAMFLGNEKKDNLAVMINSTDGRSYRGHQS
jgi:peptidoglycan DL-endopeptidase CwlO